MKRATKPSDGAPAPKKPRTTAAKKKDFETRAENEEDDEDVPTAGKSGQKARPGKQMGLWEPAEVLSAEHGVPGEVSRAVVRLLEEGNSIPFLARYRREATGGMLPDTLRHAGDGCAFSYSHLCVKCVFFCP